MKKLNKLMTFLCVMALISTSMGTVSYASNTSDFVVKNGILTAYSGSDNEVIIPDNLGIVAIDYDVFRGMQSIYSVIIPQGVTLIGNDAFADCQSLISVSISNGMTTICDEAFLDCQELTTINIPDSVKTIGNSAFYYCKMLKSISLPDSVTSIGRDAFISDPLTSIVLPKNLTAIEEGMFVACTGLTSVTIPDGVKYIGNEAFAGCTRLSSIDIPDSVTAMGFAVFGDTGIQEPVLFDKNSYLCYVPKSFANYTIPNSVKKISGGAFYGCSNIKSVVIPSGVLEIGKLTFYNCTSLNSVIIPDTVTTIGDCAFYGCTNLTSLSIPQSVTTIGERAFSLTCLTAPILTDNERTLCFVPASMKSYTIPNTVKKIGAGAFEGCVGVSSLIIPDGVTSIGKNAFSECSNLVSLTIPESVSEIDAYAFNKCESLTSINLPKKLTAISIGLFAECSNLETLILPNSITSIGDCAFYNCLHLSSINIPYGVTSIGNIAFADTALTSIYIPNGNVSFNEYVFGDSVKIIYGLSSSTAETYAKTFNITFIPIDRTALKTSSAVTVNDTSVAFQAYTIDGNNYFKLRDLSMAINGTKKEFNIEWDGAKNAIAITSNAKYVPNGGELANVGINSKVSAILSSTQIYVDGKAVSLTVYTIDGYNYFKLRDIGKMLNFGVNFDKSTNKIVIDTSVSYTA